MRNKKNNSNKLWVYIIVAILAVTVVWAISKDIPFNPEQVEELLEKKLG